MTTGNFARRLAHGAIGLGVLATAVLGASTAASATSAPVNYWSNVCPTSLHQGEGDGCVVYLQQRLNTLNNRWHLYGTNLVVDGSFGPLTFKAVEAFQKWFQYWESDLAVDGQVGPMTKTAIDESIACITPGAVCNL